MNQRNYTVTLKDRTVRLSSDDLAHFRDMFLGASELTTRMSELIWLDMYILDAEFGVSPHEIIAAIKEVESGPSAAGTKPPTQFKNLPLKGLWHKHYFSAHFIVTNILLGLGSKGIDKLVTEVMDPTKSPVITQEMIEEVAHRVARDPIEERNAAKKLTGEWVIYAEHDGKNYYLCCNTHDAGDQLIFDRIARNCVRDFPDLMAWITAKQ